MEQYILKAAVIAEIKRRINFVEKRLERNNSYNEEGNAAWERDKELYDAYNSLLSSLDTFEVKEVDLEKELDSMITPELKFHKALPSLFDVAKHFFELGLKAQKGEV